MLKSLSRKAAGQFCSLARRLLKSTSWLVAPGGLAAGVIVGGSCPPEAALAATKSGIGMASAAGIPSPLSSVATAACDTCIRMVTQDHALIPQHELGMSCACERCGVHYCLTSCCKTSCRAPHSSALMCSSGHRLVMVTPVGRRCGNDVLQRSAHDADVSVTIWCCWVAYHSGLQRCIIHVLRHSAVGSDQGSGPWPVLAGSLNLIRHSFTALVDAEDVAQVQINPRTSTSAQTSACNRPAVCACGCSAVVTRLFL